MLGGIGEINDKRQPNFLIVKKDTSRSEIEETFNQFMKRNDIAIILINQYVSCHVNVFTHLSAWLT
jgi:V-type H+-transporting ATPase subunit F